MRPAELLAVLTERGVLLSVADGRLRVNAPKGVLTPALQSALAAHKHGLIELLSAPDAVEHAPAASLAPPGGREHLPVSYAQQGERYLNQLMPGSSVSNFNVSWLAEGALDVAALEQGL